MIENVVIDFINIGVAAGENSTIGKVLTVRKWKLINARIDVVDEIGKGVVWQLKAGKKFDGSIFCSVMTMSNIQLPLSKVMFFILSNIEMLVLMEMQNLYRRPKQGALHTGIDNIWPGFLDDNREDLLKVSTKTIERPPKKAFELQMSWKVQLTASWM